MKVFIFTLRRLDGKTRTATVKAENCTLALLIAVKECYHDNICAVNLRMAHSEDFKEWSITK